MKAARVDGAGFFFTIFRRILLPISSPIFMVYCDLAVHPDERLAFRRRIRQELTRNQ